MSLKNKISKMLPAFIMRRLIRIRDRRSLAAVPSQDCPVECLWKRSADELAALFRDPVADHAWQQVAQQLEGFEIPDMTGGVNPGDRRAIFYLVRTTGALTVLEVGTHIGASTCHLAAAIGQTVSELSASGPRLVSVDVEAINDPERRPWRQYGAPYSPEELVTKLGCSEFVSFRQEKSLEYLASGEQMFDVIFLDGDHSAQTTYQEIPLALSRLKPGGVILLHDYFPGGQPLWSNGVAISGPYLAVERLKREGALLDVIPLGELPWPTKLGSRKTSLAVLVSR
ncbi:MAG: class I SAM-dependent methyltransferase [Planctomycetota bacterium]|nr:class I SAM-dependent methyltransferase [Planctomycetota bacterium]